LNNGGSGSFTLQGGRVFATSRSFKNNGAVAVASGSKFTIRGRGNYTQLLGTTTVDGILKAHGLINIQTGDLFGTGTLAGNLQSSGAVTPGDSPTQTGLLAVGGTYTQTSTGSLNIGIAGVTPGTQYGQMNATGAATLDGIPRRGALGRGER
jgi:hypothetical protein